MGESLIGIICIHDISPPILSSVLTRAYQKANDLDFSPSLLLTETTRDALHRYTRHSVTHPPVDSPFKSPFLGWNIRNIARFLSENAEGSMVKPGVFLVADERTGEDGDSLLLVQNPGQAQGHRESETAPKCVRLAAEYVNIQAVAVSIATSGVEELVSLADSDGVFRGGSEGGQQPPKKREKAPKKQI